MIFHEIRLLADDSHETRKMSQNLSVAAVMIGALRVRYSICNALVIDNEGQLADTGTSSGILLFSFELMLYVPVNNFSV